MEKLKKPNPNPNNELVGLLSYSILDNPKYQAKLQYVPEGIEDKDLFIFDIPVEGGMN
jgi:hypothetical protein